MNCDHVFDVLTRGPFPTGDESDDAVECHLADCPQCRRLASALRPAIELFEEAVAPDESQALPAYWGEVEWSAGSVSSDESREEKPNRLPECVRPAATLPMVVSNPRAHGLMFAAAVLLGIALVGINHFGSPSTPASRTRGLEALQALRPGVTCLSLVTPVIKSSDIPKVVARSGDDEQSALKTIRCCLECHATESSLRVGDAAMARIGRGCQICHLQFH